MDNTEFDNEILQNDSLFESEPTKVEEIPEVEDDRPNRFSTEWSDYVMSLFSKDELREGKPTCDGLRRIVQLLYGEIVHQNLSVHHVNEKYAAVTAHIVLPRHSHTYKYGDVTFYSGSAECTIDNTDDPYAKYPLATAETRALGRAFKMALGLQHVLTAEESSKKSHLVQVSSNEEQRTEGSIEENQIKFIERMLPKLGIEHNEPLVIANVILGAKHKNLSKLTHAEALTIIEVLNQWSQSSDNIPKPLKKEDK